MGKGARYARQEKTINPGVDYEFNNAHRADGLCRGFNLQQHNNINFREIA